MAVGPSKKFLLKRHLKEDETDEKGDIKKYGMRAEEAKEHPGMKSQLRGIQSDEKGHNKKIKLLRGRL